MKSLISLLAAVAAYFGYMYYMDTVLTRDAEKEYELVKKHGDRFEICIQAGVVAETYLSAKNEEKYAEWKAIEENACR